MLTKVLSQYKYLKKEILQMKRRFKYLNEENFMHCTNGIFEYYFESTEISNEIQSLKELIKLNIYEYLLLEKQIEEYVQSIDDSLIRQIMRSRYLEGKVWQEIAFEIGEYDESYPRRKHNDYLKTMREGK